MFIRESHADCTDTAERQPSGQAAIGAYLLIPEAMRATSRQAPALQEPDSLRSLTLAATRPAPLGIK